MHVFHAIRAMLESAGISQRAASRMMGKKETTINNMLGGLHMPSFDFVNQLANICGFDLIARKREDGTEILITPTKYK